MPRLHFISDVCSALALPLEEVGLARSQGTRDMALCKSASGIWMEHMNGLLLPPCPSAGGETPAEQNAPSPRRDPRPGCGAAGTEPLPVISGSQGREKASLCLENIPSLPACKQTEAV